MVQVVLEVAVKVDHHQRQEEQDKMELPTQEVVEVLQVDIIVMLLLVLEDLVVQV